MTVTEMPADTDEMLRVLAADFQQRLCRRDDLDQPAILEHQCVATAHRDCLFQIEQELKPVRARHHHPPPMAIVEIEHNGVGWRLAPAMLRLDLRRADHSQPPF